MLVIWKWIKRIFFFLLGNFIGEVLVAFFATPLHINPQSGWFVFLFLVGGLLVGIDMARRFVDHKPLFPWIHWPGRTPRPATPVASLISSPTTTPSTVSSINTAAEATRSPSDPVTTESLVAEAGMTAPTENASPTETTTATTAASPIAQTVATVANSQPVSAFQAWVDGIMATWRGDVKYAVRDACLAVYRRDDLLAVHQELRRLPNQHKIPRYMKRYYGLAVDDLEALIRETDEYDLWTFADSHLERLLDFLRPYGVSLTNSDYARYRAALAYAYLERGQVPPKIYQDLFVELPILMQKNERVYFATVNTKVVETHTETSYEGGSRGVSIRVAKGVSFRVGNHRGQRVTDDVPVSRGRGLTVVTDTNLYYVVSDVSVRIPLKKLVSVKQSGSIVELYKEAAKPKPIMMDFKSNDEAEVFAMALKRAPHCEIPSPEPVAERETVE